MAHATSDVTLLLCRNDSGHLWTNLQCDGQCTMSHTRQHFTPNKQCHTAVARHATASLSHLSVQVDAVINSYTGEQLILTWTTYSHLNASRNKSSTVSGWFFSPFACSRILNVGAQNAYNSGSRVLQQSSPKIWSNQLPVIADEAIIYLWQRDPVSWFTCSILSSSGRQEASVPYSSTSILPR